MGHMCGRFAVTTDPALLAEKIKAIDEATGASERAAEPNYNVAPTTSVATVVSRHSEPDDEPTRRVRLMRWGLVPPWVKAGPDGAPDNKGPLLINARADKVATSPAFRGSAKGKRCLVPMDGWYEWRPNPDAGGKKAAKTPFFMHRVDGDTLFMAGLWSVWKPAKDADPLLSCTIITTDAVGELAADPRPDAADPGRRRLGHLAESRCCAGCPAVGPPPDVHGVAIREVSTLVNSIRNNGPELLEPAKPAARTDHAASSSFSRMVKRIGARLASIKVRGRDPFGGAVGVFSGGPAAGSQQSVVGAAGEGEVVDVGGVAFRVVGDVVDFAVVAGQVAARCRTAAVLGVQHNSLTG